MAIPAAHTGAGAQTVQGEIDRFLVTEMFTDLCSIRPCRRTQGAGIGAVQHRMARVGEHRSASAVDLVIAATAAHHGLAVLHNDADYRAIARHASDLTEHNIHDIV
ncbi:PIN domain-containing protein [Streptomyces mirabilis]|uniref:PIN domain-containing protein n=1 Tax=Streptomyces mirabilis TaxID=68239 RepID=UPI0036A7C01D